MAGVNSVRSDGVDLCEGSDIANQGKRLHWQKIVSKIWEILCKLSDNKSTNTVTFNSVEDSIHFLRNAQKRDENLDTEWRILSTGSLYIVGDTLSALNWSEE